MTKLADIITNNISNNTQVFRLRDWTQADTLEFHRHRLLEKMIDQLDWSLSQAEEYYDKQKERVRMAQRRFTGDEISTTQLQAAIAEAQSASLNVDILRDELDALQDLLEAETGKPYTPFKRSATSNLRKDSVATIPADLRDQLKALGITPETEETVANTRGTGEEGFENAGATRSRKDNQMFKKKA